MLKRLPRWGPYLYMVWLVLLMPGVNAMPVASFTADQTSGCLPLNVQFTSTSTGAVSWKWDLGNGNSSTLPNPSNLYTSPGNYTITLIAYDAQGNADTARYVDYISVVGRPTADFSCPATTACPDNNSFQFSNSSTGAVTYLWDFGDGTTSTQANPTHSYSHAGIFTVTLIAKNIFGCQDIKTRNHYITIKPKPDATVNASSTATCDASTVFQFSNTAQNAVSWKWSFGDGTFSTQQGPAHVFPGPGNYPVQVIVTNTDGCSDTTDVPVEITIGLNNWADFTVDATSGCEGLAVNFWHNNNDVQDSYWDFGDGSYSLYPYPSHTYTSPGTYSVLYIVTTTTGCADTVYKPNLIQVGATPVANFQVQNPNGCAPHAVQFINNSINVSSCQWFFGDGSTSTQLNPTHTYTNSGTYTVTLQCFGQTGCSNTIVKQQVIKVTDTKAIFSATKRSGCPPLQTNFNAFSSSAGLTYLWDFGDGTSSTLQNPQHTYSTAGNFDVTLTVTDSLGCTATETKPAYIQTINPAAGYIPPPVTTGCAPLTAQFTDGATGGYSWYWDFGDGTTSTQQNPTHTYDSPGNYTVSLTTTATGGGCVSTISNFNTFEVSGGDAGFTHTASICPPYIADFTDTSDNAVSWLWDFGDGTTSTLQNPSHTFAVSGYHSVSLTITTAAGCTYTTMQSNSVYFEPFGANFYGIPLDTVFPSPVQWYANSVGATSWLWSFGDGDTSTLENPLHTYLVPGNYPVTLWVSNGLCSLFYDPPPFNFGQPDSSGIPQGNMTGIEEQKGCAPLNVHFTNRVNASVAWHWDFGDGDTSNLQFPTHQYRNPGIYSVTLTAIDSFGIVNTLQMDSMVTVSGPRAGFMVNQSTSCSSTNIDIIDTSWNANTWRWDMGDGTIETTQNPAHIYSTGQSSYVISQTVTDTAGCSASLSMSIFSSFVNPLIVSESEVCGDDTVSFSTSLTGYQQYLWNFGDGSTSALQDPDHTYSSEGVYNVSLTVTDMGGCAQTYFLSPAITVRMPNASFTTVGTRQGCNELEVEFINTSSNADSYQWELGNGNYSSAVNPVHTYTPGVYDVTLTAFRGACVSTVSMPNYIRVDTAHAAFTYTSNQDCAPVIATFQDMSVNPVSWFWYFGDGDTSIVQNPIHTYPERPWGSPVLVMTDVNGCVDSATAPKVPVIMASFTTSADSGCYPFTVEFHNNSTMLTNSWYWDFGDGTTSTQKNPVHTYNQSGKYNIMLVVSAPGSNCADTLFVPQKITVLDPRAAFVSTDLPACAPSLVTFINQSVDADQYLWDFGDSSTSTNVNPEHIYNSPGIYTVTLIAKSSLGCSDTITRQHYVTVLGPVTNFTASVLQGCSPLEVVFTDNSINANSYSWNFGDGNNDFTTSPTHVFTDTGYFTVSLVTSDTAGCVSFYELPQQVHVDPSPRVSFTMSDSAGCGSVFVSFIDSTSGYSYLRWDFGDGDSSTVNNPQHLYQDPGTYTVNLTAYNTSGCNATALPATVEVYPAPQANFSVNAATGCLPFHAQFADLSTNLDQAQYLWDFGNGYTSTDANPQFDFTTSGSYTISLTVTNVQGCSSSVSYPSLIYVSDSIPPVEPNVLSVSVVSDTEVKLIWQNVPDVDLASYIIYRSDGNMNYFRSIYQITNVNNTNFALTSDFTDQGLNTLQNTYSYKVAALDTCGNSIPLDSLQAHTTINISSRMAGDDIDVSWTPYGGCPISSYMLFRATPGEDFIYLATVDSDTLNYTDTTIICPVQYTYRVMATDLNGTTYTSFSDTSATIPLNILQGQVVEATRSTVVDNSYILTEWNQPQVHPEMVSTFDIYRSTDNFTFNYLTSVPSLQTDFFDYDVDVQSEHYYYKVLVVNTCNIDQDLSDITSSILLKGTMNEAREVHLEWTPYEGWNTGVDYYILEKRDEDGHWQVLRQVDGSILDFRFED